MVGKSKTFLRDKQDILHELPFAATSGVLIIGQQVPFAIKTSSKPTTDEDS